MAQHFGCSYSGVANALERADLKHLGLKAPRPERNKFWKGGKPWTDVDGYVWVRGEDPNHPYTPRGFVREHRLVMERVLGRYLLPTEVVDHRDGNRANNAPENLRLFASNGEHLRETRKGKCPNWTPEGFARMKAAAQRKHDAAEARRLQQSGNDAPLLP